MVVFLFNLLHDYNNTYVLAGNVVYPSLNEVIVCSGLCHIACFDKLLSVLFAQVWLCYMILSVFGISWLTEWLVLVKSEDTVGV